MWPFSKHRSPPKLPPQPPDLPQPFGCKTVWWVVPATDTQVVAGAFGLKHEQDANWITGIKYAYQDCVFVTPPIDGWTFVTGFQLPPHGTDARDKVREPLLRLSKQFGTAFVFATHRVVEYHVWAMAARGEFVRGFGYLGESGATFWNEGSQTPEEEELGFAFFDERSPEVKDEGYWDRDDLTYPDEEKVMGIARAWCLSPEDLEEYQHVAPTLGLLGTHATIFQAMYS